MIHTVDGLRSLVFCVLLALPACGDDTAPDGEPGCSGLVADERIFPQRALARLRADHGAAMLGGRWNGNDPDKITLESGV